MGVAIAYSTNDFKVNRKSIKKLVKIKEWHIKQKPFYLNYLP